MAMTQDQLVEVMIFHLKNFSNDPDSIDENTIHESVLDDSGFGTATPKRIYKALIRWTLQTNGNGDPSWPANWVKLSVRDLAGKLVS